MQDVKVLSRVAPAIRKFLLKLECKVHTRGLVTTSQFVTYSIWLHHLYLKGW